MNEWPSMGNYAFYILMTYGLTIILMLLEPFVLKAQRKAAIKSIVRWLRINANSK